MGSGPARDEASGASPSASSSRPLVVAEGGFPEPPGSCLQGKPAGRRILFCPCDASRRAPSSERDAATLALGNSQSNESDAYPERTVDILLMHKARKTVEGRTKCGETDATRIHINVVQHSLTAYQPNTMCKFAF
jgi:hypothetical protein